MSTLKISACIIGYNEEKKVEDCLGSLEGIADEIIFVDSFSSDNTLKIVRKFKAKIIQKKFEGYVKQKNIALDAAQFNWVICLDCDERLSAGARKILFEIKNNVIVEEISGYRFNRLTFYIYRWIRHSGWYPDRKLRFFRKDRCRWEGDYLHETVSVASGVINNITADILHYSFMSISDHLHTIEKFSDAAANEAFTKGRRCSMSSVIFRTLWVGIRKIFLEFAFLDGAAGIILTGLSMTATWCKYSRLYFLSRAALSPDFLIKNRKGYDD